MDNTKFKKQVYETLKNIKDINSDTNIVDNKTLHEVVIDDNQINLILNIKGNSPNYYNKIQELCKKYVKEINNKISINIILTSDNINKKTSSKMENNSNPVGLKNIILIASGKGGVGKSTVTNNLAISLAKRGLKVGILDADIYGPSQPRMLGINNEKPSSGKNGKINTIEKYGIRCMSIGLLIDEKRPIVWRGPMVHGALEQLIKDVNWGELDMLLVDMPPGTGDIHLTLSQKFFISGAIIVSTPQDIALIDAQKGLNMFKKVNVPIIGIIENMSFFLCPNCNERHEIFGNGGAKETANNLKETFLGEIPLYTEIRIKSDNGEPIIEKNNDQINKYFFKITDEVEKFLKENSAI